MEILLLLVCAIIGIVVYSKAVKPMLKLFGLGWIINE